MFAGVVVIAAAAVAQQPGNLESPALQGPSMGIRHLQPIAESDIARFAEILHLAAPQTLFMQEAFARYQPLAQARVRERFPALDEVSHVAADAFLSVSPTAPELVAQLNAGENDLTRAIQELDAGFFREVESILAEHQRPAMQRLHWRRTRQAYPPPGECRFPLADLTAFVEAQQLEPETVAALDTLLVEYEAVATPKFERLFHEWATLRTKIMAIAMTRQDSRGLAPLANSMQRELAETNETFILRMAGVLPQPLSRRFVDAYRTSAGYVGFPDLLDPRDLADRLVEPINDEIIRAALESIRATFLMEYDRVCAALVARNHDMMEHQAERLVNRDKTPFTNDLRKLRESRWNLSEKFVRNIRDLLQPVAGSPPDTAIQQYLELQRSTRHAAERDAFPA